MNRSLLNLILSALFAFLSISEASATSLSTACSPSTLVLSDDTTSITATLGFSQYVWVENGFLRDTTTTNVYTRQFQQSIVYVVATDSLGCSLTATTSNYTFSPCNVTAHLCDSIGGGGGISSYSPALVGTDLVKQDSLMFIGTAHKLYDDHGGVVIAVKRNGVWVVKESITLGTLYLNYPIPYGTIGKNVAVHSDLLFISHENATIYDSSKTINRQGLVYTYLRDGNDWNVIDTTMAASFGGLFGRDLAAGNGKLAIASRGGVWIYNVFDSTTSFSQHIDIPAERVQIEDSMLVIGNADSSAIGELRFYRLDTGGQFVLTDSLQYSQGYVNDGFGNTFHLKDSMLVVALENYTVNEDSNAGKVIVYKNQGSGWIATQELISPMPSNHFGSSVAVDGIHLFIGERGADSNHLFQQTDSNIGAVYHFKKIGAYYELNQRLNSPDFMTTEGKYGETILLEDSTAYIADALRDNGNFTQTQAIFIYDIDSVDGNKETQLMVSICSGDSVSLDTATYYSSGIYSHLYTSQYGCDSNVVLNLVVNPTYRFDTTGEICGNDSVYFQSQFLDTTGIYTSVYTTSFGCDSIHSLNLTVHPVYDLISLDTICNGDSVLFDGLYYQNTGYYSFSTSTQFGCDSAYALQLTVMPVYDDLISDTICSGDSISFSGQFYKDPGLHPYNGISEFGCDSTVILDLTVFESHLFQVDQAICSGDSILFFGQFEKDPGVYTRVFTTDKGCDSIYRLDLTLNPSYDIAMTDTICFGDSALFNNEYYQKSGYYSVSKKTMNGCDSMASLSLVVIDLEQPVIAPAGNSLLANLGYDRYHWYIDGVFYQTTSLNYITNLGEGEYTVIGEVSGCFSDESRLVALSVANINGENGIDIFPNPTHSKIAITSEYEIKTIEILDIAGRTLAFSKYDGETEVHLDISGFSQGQYFLRIASKNEVAISKLIKY